MYFDATRKREDGCPQKIDRTSGYYTVSRTIELDTHGYKKTVDTLIIPLNVRMKNC